MSQRFIYTRCSVLRIFLSSPPLCSLPIFQTCKVGNMTFTFRITLRYLPPRLRHIFRSPYVYLRRRKSYFLLGNFHMFHFLENILPNVGGRYLENYFIFDTTFSWRKTEIDIRGDPSRNFIAVIIKPKQIHFLNNVENTTESNILYTYEGKSNINENVGLARAILKVKGPPSRGDFWPLRKNLIR